MTTLTEKLVQTKDDLEDILSKAGLVRFRVIDLSASGTIVVFVPPKQIYVTAKLLLERLPEGVGYYVGPLHWYECQFSPHQYMIL